MLNIDTLAQRGWTVVACLPLSPLELTKADVVSLFGGDIDGALRDLNQRIAQHTQPTPAPERSEKSA